MTDPDIRPTKHALEKMKTRHISWGEIVEAVKHPDVIYGPDHNGSRVFQKDTLAVVVSRDDAVITVLLKSYQRWTDEDARNRDSRLNHPSNGNHLRAVD